MLFDYSSSHAYNSEKFVRVMLENNSADFRCKEAARPSKGSFFDMCGRDEVEASHTVKRCTLDFSVLCSPVKTERQVEGMEEKPYNMRHRTMGLPRRRCYGAYEPQLAANCHAKIRMKVIM